MTIPKVPNYSEMEFGPTPSDMTDEDLDLSTVPPDPDFNPSFGKNPSPIVIDHDE